MAQPSLRDFGYWRRNPTLERVGYSQISLREIGVGYSRDPLREMSVGNIIGYNSTRAENAQTPGSG